jgi:hypothetical protein
MSLTKDWMKQIIYILIFSTLLFSCDSFQEDVLPAGDEVLELQEAMRTVPNTPLYIDLKRDIRSSQVVRFEIESVPDRGTVSISSNAILEYIPHQDFTSGTDFFALSLEDENGQVLDIDSLFISMGEDVISGGFDEAWYTCDAMALSDFVTGYQNQELIVYPLENDGFCDSSYQSFEISILEEPEHGTLTNVYSHYQTHAYSYQPDVDFIGDDEFMYDITYIDSLGNEQYSLAKVFIEVIDYELDSCASAIYPYFYDISDSAEFVEFLPVLSTPLCQITEWDVEILEVAFGAAEVTEYGWIRYFPVQEPIDSINYLVKIFDQTFENTIIIFRNYHVPDSTYCTDAEDDWFYLYITDTSGRSDEPFILNILENDHFCNEDDLSVMLLTEPDLGDASLDVYNQLVYYVDEEFAGTQEFQMLYEICGPDLCDSAFIHFTLEQ